MKAMDYAHSFFNNILRALLNNESEVAKYSYYNSGNISKVSRDNDTKVFYS